MSTDVYVSMTYAERVESRKVRNEAEAWLNKWAMRKSDTLPAATQGDPNDCVFARALGGSWNGHDFALDPFRRKLLAPCFEGNADTGMRVNVPPVVRDFIGRFDRGEYPDLIAKAFMESTEAEGTEVTA